MWENFKNGFIKENPVFTLYLGMCSCLALSSTVDNALGMGLCVTIILTITNMIISAIRKITPDEVRIPVYIVVIATVVTIVEMLVHAYAPTLYDALGVFLSLIVVNCIILGRAESYASKNGIVASAIDGIGKGLGYTFAIFLIALFREFLGTMSVTVSNPFSGSIICQFAPEVLKPYAISLFTTSTGSFFAFAIFAAVFSALKDRKPKAAKEAK